MATSGDTFGCLREANSTEISAGVIQALAEAPELFAFDPTTDGPSGLFPEIASKLINAGHFARIPFIAGTNLDEGLSIHSIKRENIQSSLRVLGTLFTPRVGNLTTADIRAAIIVNYSPPLIYPSVLQNTAEILLDLYPDVPALGSPFNTGNNTFGLPSGYKRYAALVEFGIGFCYLHSID